MRVLIKNAAFNICYTTLDLFLPLVMIVYVARILLPDGVGQVSYAQNIALFFVSFAELGLPVYGIREISRSRNQRDLNQVFSELFFINFVSTTCSLAAYLMLIAHVTDMRDQLPLFLACGTSIFFGYFNIDWLYQGREEYVYIVSRSILIKLISLTSVFLFVHTSGDYVKYALIISLSGGCNHILNVLHVRKFASPVLKGLSPKRHVKPLLILAVGTLLPNIYGRIDIAMLGMMSTKAATGYYSYANTAIFMITTVCTSISTVFFPRLCYYYEKDREEFDKLLQLGMRVLMFISIPACVGIFLLIPKVVMILFGSEFLPMVKTVRILAILIIMSSFSHLICYQMLLITGNEKEQIPAYFAAAMVNIGLNYMFIPLWENNGAAAASVISELVVNGYRLYKVRCSNAFDVPWKALWQALAAAAGMGIAVVFVIRIDMPLVSQCAAGIAGGCLVYGILNLLMKNELTEAMVRKFVKKTESRR